MSERNIAEKYDRAMNNFFASQGLLTNAIVESHKGTIDFLTPIVKKLAEYLHSQELIDKEEIAPLTGEIMDRLNTPEITRFFASESAKPLLRIVPALLQKLIEKGNTP